MQIMIRPMAIFDLVASTVHLNDTHNIYKQISIFFKPAQLLYRPKFEAHYISNKRFGLASSANW